MCVSSEEVVAYLDGEFARSKITNFIINLIGNTTLDDIGAGDGDRHLATRIVQFINDELLARAADFGQKWTGDKDPQVQELLWKDFILETR
jgi:hypothetical protein